MLLPGTVVEGYRVERVLGHGGMGLVYEATQLSLDRVVALKVVASHLSADPTFRDRFRREGRLQAALEHPNIVPVYEAGESEYGLFLAMRLIRGDNLKTLLMRERLEAQRTLRLLRQIANALDTAHDVGLIHRDVKPQNILVGPSDHAYLADFGLVREQAGHALTESGQVLGSLDYIAPEQIDGACATVASDVYSFGAVAYECLTGAVPYPRESQGALLYAHLSEQPKPPSVLDPSLPVGVDDVVTRAMAKDPDARYVALADLITDLELALADNGRRAAAAPAPGNERETDPTVPDHGATVADRLRRQERFVPPTAPRRHTGQWVAAVAGAVLLALGAGILAYLSTRGAKRPLIELTPVTAHHAGFTLTHPVGWKAVPKAKVTPRLPIRVALAFTRDGIQLQAGRGATPWVAPPRIASSIHGEAAVVKIGRREFFRNAGKGVVLWTSPESASTIVLGCTGHKSLDACEAVLASIRVAGAAPRLSPDPRFLAKLQQALAPVGERLDKTRADMAAAAAPAGQAVAAESAAAVYAKAANALPDVAPNVLVRAATRKLEQALTGAAVAWSSLSRAAGAADRAAYDAARARVANAQQAVAAATEPLAVLGYDLR